MGRVQLSMCAVVVAGALSGPTAVYGQPIEVRSREATERANGPEQRAPLNVTLVESQGQAKRGEERETKSDEHERLDLIAQQKAASAAYFAAVASGVGTVLIFFALIQTSLANMRQMRAYVGVDKIRVTDNEDGGREFCIVVKNFGQTPAYRFDGHCELKVGERSTRTDYPPDEIMPLHNVNMAFTITKEAMTSVFDGTHKLSLVGGGSYKDLAGRTRRMCFSMEYHQPTGSLIAYGGENRAE